VALECQVADLSCDGLFLKSDYVGARGERVRLDIALPGAAAPLALEGEVVRTVNAAPAARGMGIRFFDVALPIRLQLANYMLLQTSRTLT
jgi:hypothetical protein